MKPSDAKLHELIKLCHADDIRPLDLDLIVDLAQAELARRRQPASVPAELVKALEWVLKDYYGMCVHGFRPSANHLARIQRAGLAIQSAAYGREQAQQSVVGIVRDVLHNMPECNHDHEQAVVVHDDLFFDRLAIALKLPESPTC